jgi:hypothetical protein
MGLLRGVARTAVIAGTATAVSNNVSRRQAGRWAKQQDEQDAQAAAQQQAAQQAPAPVSMDEKMTQLKSLAELKSQGILSDAEFEQQKAAILNS